jgi:hypothetical protein
LYIVFEKTGTIKKIMSDISGWFHIKFNKKTTRILEISPQTFASNTRKIWRVHLEFIFKLCYSKIDSEFWPLWLFYSWDQSAMVLKFTKYCTRKKLKMLTRLCFAGMDSFKLGYRRFITPIGFVSSLESTLKPVQRLFYVSFSLQMYSK